MSLSHFLRPFDLTDRPQLEPEVKRAILAAWGMSSTRPRVEWSLGKTRWPQDRNAVSRTLDGGAG